MVWRSFIAMTGEFIMMRKLMTMALIAGSFSIAACNTVRGAANDLNSAANCTENTINGQRC